MVVYSPESHKDLIIHRSKMRLYLVQVAEKAGKEAEEGLLLKVRSQILVRLCKDQHNDGKN
jgi:hypothetical protein